MSTELDRAALAETLVNFKAGIQPSHAVIDAFDRWFSARLPVTEPARGEEAAPDEPGTLAYAEWQVDRRGHRIIELNARIADLERERDEARGHRDLLVRCKSEIENLMDKLSRREPEGWEGSARRAVLLRDLNAALASMGDE